MTNISQNFKRVLSLINQFMTHSEGNIWFRGHSNIGENGEHEDYKLSSTLFRRSQDLEYIRQLEINYIYEFMTKGYSLHQTKDEWDLLYIMQHHGTPTRLLDWTTSLSVAIYFATRNWNPKKNTPTIWFLDPAKLNETLIDTTFLEVPSNYNFNKYVERENLPSRAIAPNYNSNRLIAQQGQFTLQGNTINDLEKELALKKTHYTDILDKIELTEDIYYDVGSFLHMNGIDDFTVYPDLDGLSKLIKNRKGFR
ncbi:FRG domain-containing protein [Gracilibacillus marinus]|uniref:FRG domain-containing protein n=1 Tax=Gracilibacillus marinus TaxID=630535 RepID=A0ABV8VSS8_9BACI